jgi:hypothetical protein
VVGAIVEALEKMQLKYPTIDKTQRAELERSRELLLSERK